MKTRRSTSDRRTPTRRPTPRRREWVICVRSEGYPAALEPRKLYAAIPDAQAAAEGLIRVIDESGEDYLYPRKYFRAVSLDDSTRRALRAARNCN